MSAYSEWSHGRRTSAVLGTLSQKTSILKSPRVVWRVTDMVVGSLEKAGCRVVTRIRDMENGTHRSWGMLLRSDWLEPFRTSAQYDARSAP